MRHVLCDLSTDTLARVVVGLETRIIEGVANDDDIDTYVWAQWEITDRLAPKADETPGGPDGNVR